MAVRDPETGRAWDRRRKNAVRYAGITVNGPKAWSLATTLNPGDRRGL